MRNINGKIVKIHWEDACDATGSTEHVAHYELLPSYNVGEVVGDKLDRVNLRHAYAEDRGDVEEPDEGITIPKGCITKIEIYKLDRVINYGLAQRHKRKFSKHKDVK